MMNERDARETLLAEPTDALVARARAMTLDSFGSVVTYSRKVFLPLTQLCRDVCHYCTFAKAPREVKPYLSIEEMLAVAHAGVAAGCREALFTLGDRPEARYAAARAGLAALGHGSTLSYLREAAQVVREETGLLAHLNPGVMDDADYAALKPVSVSMGLMLESASDRLCEKGGPHHGSPDKAPARRLASIAAAGRAGVPFTTGILIGIGETRGERIEALLAIRELHRKYGHIQEVIVQNFRAKPGTKMAQAPEPGLDEHRWTIAAARLILGPEMVIQAPPNLHAPHELAALLDAGVNDWGGVSPVTADHVNPEAPWPHLDVLAEATRAAGRTLRERLAIGPRFAQEPERWMERETAKVVRRSVDARGLPIIDGWHPGTDLPMPSFPPASTTAVTTGLRSIAERAAAGDRLSEQEVERLFTADGGDVAMLAAIADELRQRAAGDAVSYVVNRNINYTNICLYKCGFCAFSKGSTKAERGPAYRLDLEEVGRRAAEAAARGATEVCLQGGIHPEYYGETYLQIVRAVRRAAPSIHIHAFSPLEVTHGAGTLGLPLQRYLAMLRSEGLSSLPGTAAEVLHPEVRAVICPDKISADEWLGVMRAAHAVGLRSTATIMFGHVDRYAHWAAHLLAIRDLQEETGGFTEFVPLPFVHMEAPIWRKGRARSGPSARETLLMHAIARLVLHPLITNIQASWVKLGEEGVVLALRSGCNDLGGTLMDESITRAAGGTNGQLCDPQRMAALAARAGRFARQRTTMYGTPVAAQPAEASGE
ncbi:MULTISPECIES: 5-amino-6-(D-ribitylamino)uracil--L-tyrosine 4-hydroxyphenyl transferase CofH [unclassified Sphingomonas]|uniref:5-amino-6-(D-ribitylamino)uracil--L-tyrosine 4-hydroxyphenyl transferase CofH n=1 Tax=unclassified Sphingomonas TaxID=196159 RepID=UPI000700AB59|nr:MULTISPECIES: 5-amino-6-(D-ribitylamino)uracil--L-tyrosine 4-hydroxyphenyl transferase CofH [unclassified Sphingomonas]KQX24248.1 2-phospho-L-lactate guanylyltransferase [Sphingomonas sp. Root1294]KQY69579.1 2-phospho-L-lactate guanylyltransferase [Sphingomonas sp. Root50]KRB87507.1 2-phospho-L-lactate guanylyltransferase [Sphingomonas sp. Root720]